MFPLGVDNQLKNYKETSPLHYSFYGHGTFFILKLYQKGLIICISSEEHFQMHKVIFVSIGDLYSPSLTCIRRASACA